MSYIFTFLLLLPTWTDSNREYTRHGKGEEYGGRSPKTVGTPRPGGTGDWVGES